MVVIIKHEIMFSIVKQLSGSDKMSRLSGTHTWQGTWGQDPRLIPLVQFPRGENCVSTHQFVFSSMSRWPWSRHGHVGVVLPELLYDLTLVFGLWCRMEQHFCFCSAIRVDWPITSFQIPRWCISWWWHYPSETWRKPGECYIWTFGCSSRSACRYPCHTPCQHCCVVGLFIPINLMVQANHCHIFVELCIDS